MRRRKYLTRKTPLKRYVRPNKISQPTAARNRKLTVLRQEILRERPWCELQVPGVCTRRAQGLHHVKGRLAKYVLSRKHLLAACNACNDWCESHHAAAAALGLKKSKFIDDDKLPESGDDAQADE